MTTAPAELSSPFLDQPVGAPLEELLEHASVEVPLVTDLVRRPEAIAERVLDAPRVETVVKASLTATLLGSAAAGWFAFGAFDPAISWEAALLVPLHLHAALIAAIGPLYAVSVMLNARIPLARLVAVMLAAAALSALTLGATAPLISYLFHRDHVWLGPLAMVAAFVVSGLAGGLRLHSLLLATAHAHAQRSSRQMTPELLFRIGIFARVGTMLLGLTTSLAVWSVIHTLGGTR
ncbi:MAG: hypothetical protein QM723_20810 [Myxococcaceae bacterium]